MTARQNEAPDCAGRNGAHNHGKHTPGPWRLDPCWDILGNTEDGNGMVCQITTRAVPRSEAEANARLIAAAPELLAALKDARGAIVDTLRANGFDAPEYSPRVRAIDAALAKAEGRS